jgi:DNA-binding NarL/FixJ family response regulator
MKKDPRRRKPTRVFIADSSCMGCQLMVRALQQSRQPIKVVGSATELVDLLKGLSENPCDVAIVSADLRDGSNTGLRAVREARLCCPHIRIVVLVDSPERALVVEGFRAGVDGVFSRDEPFEMLCKCIRAVCAGQIWASSEQLRFVIEAMAENKPQPIKGANGTKLLTKREEELVQLVAEGLTNLDISRQLGLTEHTVRNYLFRIYNKLGISNRLELALYVIKQSGTEHSSDFGGAFFTRHTSAEESESQMFGAAHS